jgi:hypothetical protein
MSNSKLSETFRWMVAFELIAILRCGAETRIEFNRDIRPILSENCFYCHGFDAKNRKAGLRLDTFEGATANLDGRRPVIPGNATASEVMRRITTSDSDDLMPPPESEKQLSATQKELIGRWIEQGATYQDHWAWTELRRPEVPGGKTGAAAIDAFLDQGWQEHGVEPVQTAGPRSRLRRLSYDLRGLPPTHAEVTEFEKAPTDSVFLAFRDRWMTGLPYAEHQALRWLDLVRWADTSGLVSDEPIASGAYRAWIIEAIRANQPFDQFSIEQLAGDLLPNPTDGQMTASGYNRILNTNCEAGAIEEEQLYKLKGEHVRALGTVWLGMTTGCAECHDHKFDPLLAKDYYSLGAFFDDLVEAGVYTPGDRREPLHYVHEDKSSSARDRELSARLEKIRQQIASGPSTNLPTWEKQIVGRLKETGTRSDFIWIPARLPAPRILEGTFDEVRIDEKVLRETRARENEFRRHHAAEFITGYVFHNSQKTDAQKDAWFADVWIDGDNPPEMIGLQISQGDYGRLGWRTANYETYYWGKDPSGALKKPHPWSDPARVKRLGDLPARSGWVRLRVPFDQLIKPAPGNAYEAVGMAWLQTGGRLRWGDSGLELRTDKVTRLSLGETAIRRWWETPWNRQVYQSRAEFVPKALLKATANRDALEQEVVRAAFLESSQADLMNELRELESDLYLLRSKAMPVLASRRSDQRKTTRVLNRGDYNDRSGPIVSPAVPEFLGRLPESNKPATRLDLARWLFTENSPLVARVYVNRLWHQFFGRGISETLEDSGTQGDWPSHLSLLNWLAAEFRDSGWDRMHMVRLLTSTRAYQLDSKPSGELALRDPGNRWHARQGRFRLTAEAIRDSALRAAGMLMTTREVPRRSFFPYQPDPYWTRSDKVMYGSRHMVWETSSERTQYHRSLYTFWKRQNIHPSMLAFDAPPRQECTAKRNITNTPGQALALLNDPIFVEAARVLATRVQDANEADDPARIRNAFHLALQRKPSAAELDVLSKLLTTARDSYRNDPDAARELLAIGQSPAPPPHTAPEVAAWTTVTRAILNLHEFLNRP